MGWIHNQKLKKRADAAFDEGDTVLFDLPRPLKDTPVEDVHRAIIDAVSRNFLNKTGIDIAPDFLAYMRVYEASAHAAVMIKCGSGSRAIHLPFLTADGSGPKHMFVNPTLATF